MVILGVGLLIAVVCSAVATAIVCMDVAQMLRDDVWYKSVARHEQRRGAWRTYGG